MLADCARGNSPPLPLGPHLSLERGVQYSWSIPPRGARPISLAVAVVGIAAALAPKFVAALMENSRLGRPRYLERKPTPLAAYPLRPESTHARKIRPVPE